MHKPSAKRQNGFLGKKIRLGFWFHTMGLRHSSHPRSVGKHCDVG
jgi:hypothetical protein